MAREISETSNYSDRLIKLIPTEWVSAYVAIRGVLQTASAENFAYYICMGILTIFLPFYLRNTLHIRNKAQIVITTLSFPIWLFSLGGEPFSCLNIYEPYQSSILLTIWTTCLPIFFNRPHHLVEPSSREVTNAGPEGGH